MMKVTLTSKPSMRYNISHIFLKCLSYLKSGTRNGGGIICKEGMRLTTMDKHSIR